MNLAIRGIEAQIAHGDSFHNDQHPDLRADHILANPPFNVSDWGGERLRDDKRWEHGVPPVGNANFAWVQHFLHHLAHRGTAGFVLANGSMSSNQSGEGEIRKNIIEARLVDCIIALPGQLFRSTQIPACLWFLSRGQRRDRQGETLFIDARKLGYMLDRTRRDLSAEAISRMSDTYHAWRGDADEYTDVPGFCKKPGWRKSRGWRNGAARHEHGPGTTRKPDTPGGLPQLRWQQPGQCELIRNPRGSSADSDRLLPKGSPVRPPSTDPAGQTRNHPLNHDAPRGQTRPGIAPERP